MNIYDQLFLCIFCFVLGGIFAEYLINKRRGKK